METTMKSGKTNINVENEIPNGLQQKSSKKHQHQNHQYKTCFKKEPKNPLVGGFNPFEKY